MRPADMLDCALHVFMRALPIDAASALGVALSPLLGRRANPIADARARALFLRLEPGLAGDPVAAERRSAGLWRAIGRTFAEFAVAKRMLRAGRVTLDGADALDAACASGRPVILAFLHTGNWEITGAQMAWRYPGRMVAVVDLPQSKARAQIATATRAHLPIRICPAGTAMWRSALDHLARPGAILWLAADAQENGICGFPGFGQPLPAGGSAGKLVRLARRTRALVVPLSCERLSGARFVTRVLPPQDPAAMTQEAAIAALEAVFAPVARRLAGQWYMALMYRTEALS